MGQTLPKPGLRPFLPDDVPVLAAIFAANIEELTSEDYTEAQQLMDSILQADLKACPGEKFLQTLFQIRDADLVAWLNWLDGELKQASPKENG